VSAIYADDITVTGCQHYEAAVEAYQPKALAKLRVLVPSGIAPQQHQANVVRATRLLGAYIGDTVEATELFKHDIKERLGKLSAVIRAPLNCQTKWAPLRTIELGLLRDRALLRAWHMRPNRVHQTQGEGI